MSAVCVAIVGVGLVGKQVVQQLTSPALAGIFKIVSLTNSKHTLALSPAAPALDANTLLSLLPPSSQPLPAKSAHPAASYSPASPADLVKQLAADARAAKHHTILIDCTSDLAVTELYPQAIASGLSVVTPNKKGFSSSSALFQQIVDAQSAPGAGLVYLEATVGAGLPIISTLRDLLKTGDEVTKIEGVFSGTMSYIFNNFSPATPAAGPPPKFSEVVKVAKEHGYTEPHPADDLSGSDVARKLTILSRLLSINPSSLAALPSLPEGYASLDTETLIPSALASVASGDEFVQRLPDHDAEFEKMRADAEKEGKVLRYVGVIDRAAGVVKCGLEAYPTSHPFASALGGSDNIVAFHTARYAQRPLIVQGAGAGADVTAMGVVADAIKVAERMGVRVHL
ncbi:Homoserine dehydrogenase [Rhodotorula kratochvilovae]